VVGEEGVGLVPEQLGLEHLVVEAALGVVEVLVGEEMHVDAALGGVNLCNLGRREGRGSMEEERIEEGNVKSLPTSSSPQHL